MLVTPTAAVVGILKPAELQRISSASHTTTACADHAPLCRVYNTSFFPPSIQLHTGFAVLQRAIHRIYLASLAHAKKTTAHTHFATAWRDGTTPREPSRHDSQGDLQRERWSNHLSPDSSRWTCILVECRKQQNKFWGQLSIPELLQASTPRNARTPDASISLNRNISGLKPPRFLPCLQSAIAGGQSSQVSYS